MSTFFHSSFLMYLFLPHSPSVFFPHSRAALPNSSTPLTLPLHLSYHLNPPKAPLMDPLLLFSSESVLQLTPWLQTRSRFLYKHKPWLTQTRWEPFRSPVKRTAAAPHSSSHHWMFFQSLPSSLRGTSGLNLEGHVNFLPPLAGITEV